MTASRLLHRKNHRNDFHINIEKSEIVNTDNCSGCLIDINTVHEIESLKYIDICTKIKKYNIDHIMTLQEYENILRSTQKSKMRKMRIPE